nr:ricin-type beta-trefoil lectin domain protein [Kineosporia rhizophila]
MTVAVTSSADVATVRAEGAQPKVVTRSTADLNESLAALNRNAAKAVPGEIRGWYVDTPGNRVVVRAAPGAEAAARDFARTSGAGEVTVVVQKEQPRLEYDIRGGDLLGVPGAACSIGFAVQGGYVTAGHCGELGTPVKGYNGIDQGTFAAKSDQGDYAFVRTNSQWTSRPLVNSYGGPDVKVAGWQEATIGSSVCRTGITTGWRCGILLGRDETLLYAKDADAASAENVIATGQYRTTACASPGDSGGPYLSGNQAQGVHSGGWGKCEDGTSVKFYEPITEALFAFNLKLTTTAENGQGLINNLTNRCVDVPDAKFDRGARVQMWTCNGTLAQNWNYSNNVFKTSNNKCLDVAGGATAVGTAVQISDCNGTGAQKFVFAANRNLVNPQSGKCVDIAGASTANGAKLQLANCEASAIHTWRRL